ncbi:MAG TPA: Xaa-Pro peptidase family protein [Chthoniobacterales bacterium]|jgi:Xaa-Pro aminopeptidase|nr:Xaa-Pro peptidase family protein [Chthoniobacterales bacterium]
MNEAQHDALKPAPFDTARLDALLEDEGIDVLVATSKHNVQYLLGGYRFFFFDYMDAIGVSRYLPVVVYQKGRPDNSAYIGFRLESYEKQLGKFWPRVVETTAGNSTGAIQRAVEHIKGLGGPIGKVGVEASFLPWDGAKLLQAGLGNCQIVDAYFPLERLRARKTRGELTQLREASERVVASMLAVFGGCAPGQTKNELVDRLRREEVGRGLTFEYCLITAGTSLNRAPSDQRLEAGDVLSLDSGGNYKGYIGDLCRMGILGEPDAELVDLLGVIEEIQQRARRPIHRGAAGAEIFAAAHELADASPHRAYLDFVAHGMGLVSHEAPRLTSNGPVPYEGYDATRPLEADMVISIETTMVHPKRGFIKLEDTVAVTEEGCEGFGDKGRGWNRAR